MDVRFFGQQLGIVGKVVGMGSNTALFKREFIPLFSMFSLNFSVGFHPSLYISNMVHISGPKELFSSNFGPYLGVAWNGSLNYLLTSLFLFYSVLK